MNNYQKLGKSLSIVVLVLAVPSWLSAAEPAKRGVSPASAAKLKQIAQTNAARRAKQAHERDRLVQQAAQASVDQLKNERDAFNAALGKQPEYGQLKQEFDAIAALAKDPNTAKDKQKQAGLAQQVFAFAQKYEPAQTRAYAQAKIDDNRVRAILTTNFSRLLGPVKVSKHGLGWNVIQEAPVEEAPPAPPPASACFQAPYATTFTIEDYSFQTLLADTVVSADQSTGNFNARTMLNFSGSAFVGAGMGEFATIPSGGHQVKFSATIPVEKANLVAVSMPAVATANARIDLYATRLSGVGDVFTTQYLATVVAPVAWIAVYKEVDSEYTLSGAGTAAGGEWLIEVSGSAHGTCFGNGSMSAETIGNVKEICVEVLD